jgi:cytochrome c
MNTRLKFTLYLIVTITGLQCLIINKASAQTKKTTTTTTTIHHTVVKKTVAKKPTAADLAQGKALFQKSDCLTCHKMDVKLVGPAYYDVAKKYPATDANYEMLASKVIAGGSGVWGQVAMAPHPALTHADAKKIVEYVLSLKPGKS